MKNKSDIAHTKLLQPVSVSIAFLAAVLLAMTMLTNTVYADVRAKGYEVVLVGIVEVKDINIDQRQITLDAGNGKTSIVTVGEEVRNFERIKKGDVVVMEYYEGFVVALTPKGDGTTSAGSVELYSRAKKGDKPAASLVQAATVEGVVEDVDTANRIVILRGPGKSGAFKVGESVNLANVHKGDKVHIEYIEGYAISVQPPADVVGEIDIKSTSVSLIVGIDWGKGSLKLKDGSSHKLKVRGLSLGGAGIAKLDANGYVYNLKNYKDIEGTYRTMRIGLTMVEGGTSMIMKNKNGVKIRMTSKEKGARLALGPQGLKIELAE